MRGTVQVDGYTDDVGTPASNISLSRDLALAVARVLQLALAGIPITLQPQGFGEASPVATNATPEGRRTCGGRRSSFPGPDLRDLQPDGEAEADPGTQQ